jgi:hypothetical protein
MNNEDKTPKPIPRWARCVIVLALLAGCQQSDLAPQSATRVHKKRDQQADPALTGQPHWYRLGDEVYHAEEIAQAQGKRLSFIKQPRWFLCNVAYPSDFRDIATDAAGVRVGFAVDATEDASTLAFTLTLTSTDRAVVRQFEHRWNNILPFLFAFYVDGQATSETQLIQWSKFGGARWCDFLIDPGERKTWRLKVNANSILALLPDNRAHAVSVVAAFSECQHEASVFAKDRPITSRSINSDGKAHTPSLVVRSEPVNIEWSGSRWGRQSESSEPLPLHSKR